MRISDWRSDVCSSDLLGAGQRRIVLVVAVVAVIEAERLRLAFLRPAPGGRRIGSVAEDAEIVLGVLVVGLGGDAVPRRGSVAGQAQILLEDLPGVAADPAVGAIAVESVGSWLSAAAPPPCCLRSEERRVGKECVSTFRSRWSPYH